MSFVNKIKGWGQKGGAEPSALDGDVAVADDYRPRRGSASHAATDLPLADVEAAAAFDAMPQHGDGASPSSSIISEVAPSENAEFIETRLQGDTGAAPLAAALPLIGERPAAEQQRILLAMLGVGLVGLIVLTILANRLRHELTPTAVVVDRYGREHRVALNTALDRLREELVR